MIKTCFWKRKVKKVLALFAAAFVLIIMMNDPASASLVRYYNFDTASGDFTVNGATFLPSGGRGGTGAFSFDGSNDYISISLNINPSVYPQLTMGAWVKATNDSPIRQVISHDNGGYDRSLGIDNRGGGTGWSAFSGSGAVLGFRPVVLGAWAFVAVAYHQSNNSVMLYVNDFTYSESGTLGSGWNNTRIGSNPSYGEYFSGIIDDVFFFDTALSKTQLKALMDAGHPVPVPPAAVLLASGLIGLMISRRNWK